MSSIAAQRNAPDVTLMRRAEPVPLVLPQSPLAKKPDINEKNNAVQSPSPTQDGYRQAAAEIPLQYQPFNRAVDHQNRWQNNINFEPTVNVSRKVDPEHATGSVPNGSQQRSTQSDRSPMSPPTAYNNQQPMGIAKRPEINEKPAAFQIRASPVQQAASPTQELYRRPTPETHNHQQYQPVQRHVAQAMAAAQRPDSPGQEYRKTTEIPQQYQPFQRNVDQQNRWQNNINFEPTVNVCRRAAGPEQAAPAMESTPTYNQQQQQQLPQQQLGTLYIPPVNPQDLYKKDLANQQTPIWMQTKHMPGTEVPDWASRDDFDNDRFGFAQMASALQQQQQQQQHQLQQQQQQTMVQHQPQYWQTFNTASTQSSSVQTTHKERIIPIQLEQTPTPTKTPDSPGFRYQPFCNVAPQYNNGQAPDRNTYHSNANPG